MINLNKHHSGCFLNHSYFIFFFHLNETRMMDFYYGLNQRIMPVVAELIFTNAQTA